MADPATYRPAPGTIPVEPGVYTFKDADGRVIYVGKAKNLRARLSNYFQDVSQLHPRTRTMVTTANRVDWTVVSSEVEALQLEYTWIKRFDPRFNVKYRDDKSYPMLAVSTGNEYPRAFVYRGPRRKGVRYFGPYSHAWAIRETLDLLTRVFPIRTCSQGVFNRHSKLGRPCLLGYIEKCCAPCVGNVSAQEHKELVAAFCSFMAGHTDPVTKKLTAEMHKAAEQLDFERAARLRDDLEAITKAMERQAVVLGDGTDADIIATASDELETALHIFHIRGGRIRGQRGWVVENNGSISQVLQEFLVQFYGDAAEHAEAAHAAQTGAGWEADMQAAGQSPIPREVLVQVMPDDAANSETWLTQLRGSKVELRVPQRGDKRVLMETVERNAQEALKQHKLKRVGDLTARSAALQELQQALFLDEPVLRIECTDVSHIQGTDVVASLVVFEDGLPKKADYRRYKIQEAAGDGHSNDVASIAEVVRRRFQRYHEDKRIVPSTTEFSDEPVQKRFAYPPQVFIVDGGLPQVNAAQEVFEELGINDIALIGLAKRLEEVWLPGEEDPLILPRTSQALFLLQQIRDEAHRFAISFHRQQRSQRMRSSVLDSIQGLGAVRRQELVKHFGSVAKISEATVEEIAAVKGFGPKLAQSVYTALHSKT